MKYFHLIKTIALTDFKLKYQGSFLGYIWSLLKPLLLFSVLLIVFTKVFKIGGSIKNYPVYLLSGIVVWTFFLEATQTLMGSIVGKSDLIRKVYFPRIILPISNSLTSILIFVSNLVIIGFFMFYFQIDFRLEILLALLLIIELYILILGIGFLLATLYVKFRDIAHIWDVFMQMLFYATPILYTPTLLPLKLSKIQMLSPLSQIIQDFRWLVVGTDAATAIKILGFPYFLVPYVLTVVIFLLGFVIFKSAANKFPENV